MPCQPRRKVSSETNILEDLLKISGDSDFSLDPEFLKSFLTDEEYEAVALMLDLPPIECTKKRAPHSSEQLLNTDSQTSESMSEDKWEMSVNLGSVTSPVRSSHYKSGNPYLKFLRNPQKQATRWRKPVPIGAKDILNASTVEKSKFITDKIIGDFIKWKESICDSKDVEIDETVMRQLFEIGTKKPDNAKIFRRKVIPRDIFEPKMIPKQNASWSNVKKHFGKSLKKESALLRCSEELMKQTRGKSKGTEKESFDVKHSKQMWAKCESNMKEIVSSVWRNKLNYKCVQAFCQYLEQNPQIRKPEYLIQMNMFSKNTKLKEDNNDN